MTAAAVAGPGLPSEASFATPSVVRAFCTSLTESTLRLAAPLGVMTVGSSPSVPFGVAGGGVKVAAEPLFGGSGAEATPGFVAESVTGTTTWMGAPVGPTWRRDWSCGWKCL